jgi:hypothetical protein
MDIVSAVHLIVFVHGFYGSPNGLVYSSELLHQRMGPGSLIYLSNINNRWINGTEKGIDVAGERLAEEVRKIIADNASLKEISFVGLSLGGLIARYAIGLLYEDMHINICGMDSCNTIGGLRPINYISFATPHLGCRNDLNWFTENVLSHIPFIAPTTDQLFFRDHKKESNPLLFELTKPETSYMKGLGLFKHRIVFANVEGDHRVSYNSAAIWPYKMIGPYWKKPYTYLHNYDHIITRDPGVLPDKSETSYNRDSIEYKIAENLSSLDWKRVDVYFDGWFSSWLNHNNIIVVHENVNSIGKSVVRFFVDQFPFE